MSSSELSSHILKLSTYLHVIGFFFLQFLAKGVQLVAVQGSQQHRISRSLVQTLQQVTFSYRARVALSLSLLHTLATIGNDRHTAAYCTPIFVQQYVDRLDQFAN